MKKIFLVFLLAILMFSLSAQETKIKSGWNFGIRPAISFDTDLGFQYGSLIDLYYYGTGEIYPDYYYKLYLELSHFTRGSGIYRFISNLNT